MKRTVPFMLAAIALAFSGIHGFALDLTASSGIELDLDAHGERAAEAFAGILADVDARLSPTVTIDNRSRLRGGIDVETRDTRGLGEARTGITYRAAPFTARLANDTVAQITGDGTGDYIETDLALNLSWGTPDYSVFFEPGAEWYFAGITDVDRRVRTGVSTMLGDDLIADVSAELGDRTNDERYQMRISGEAELNWYNTGASTVGLSAGAGRFVSQDEQEFDGQDLPIWTYSQFAVGPRTAFRPTSVSRVGLDVPVRIRRYDHNYIAGGQLGDNAQISTQVRPDFTVSVWPAEYLELRSELGATIKRSNTPALEQTGMTAGLSAHFAF